MKRSVFALTSLALMIAGPSISLASAGGPTLSPEAKAASAKIYFERCAGCHGMLRKGATGKNLEPLTTTKKPDGTVVEGGTIKLG
ncbi:MAG: nitrite reductase, partial [Hydrogenophaga sp.]